MSEKQYSNIFNPKIKHLFIGLKNVMGQKLGLVM